MNLLLLFTRYPCKPFPDSTKMSRQMIQHKIFIFWFRKIRLSVKTMNNLPNIQQDSSSSIEISSEPIGQTMCHCINTFYLALN